MSPVGASVTGGAGGAGGSGAASGGGGGTGGAGGAASIGSVTNTGSNTGSGNTGKPGTGTTNPGLIRKEHVNIDVTSNFSWQAGHITVVPTTRIPRRLVLTANCLNLTNTKPDNNGPFTFIIDVILVPPSFNAQTCFNLYQDPFNGGQKPEWYMGLRSPKDNVILLRRMTVRGVFAACAAEDWDIPQDIQNNRSGYRLVVTCPLLHYWGVPGGFSVVLQLEMES